jgi:Fe(3+) dicitrate transport protein
MKNTLLILIAIFLCAFSVDAQEFTISGKISSALDNKALNRATVCISFKEHCTTSDEAGNYKIDHLKPGRYSITVSSVGYINEIKTVDINNSNVTLDIKVLKEASTLDSVEIKQYNQHFGLTQLNDVDGSGIYAGKKSEVIVIKDLTANKATNNARQVYSKVAGLNIYENDGGAGIQLAIGGRGLDPNRVSNFNTRQNGYDISADALGYPESYYTPPVEALERIEIVRGASSLQYGTQFGGIINFKMNTGPVDKKLEVTERLSGGSWKFFNTTTSVGGTVGKLRYYALYQHKSGDGWRQNSNFNVNTAYAAVTYAASKRLSVTAEITHMDYIEKQAGGLSDAMFADDPRQSTKARNWFKVNWNLAALIADYSISDNLKFNTRFFGLLADRSALGVIYNVLDPEAANPNALYPREYRTDTYHNWGNESRLIYTYNNKSENPFVLLGGLRYYQGNTNREIGVGNTGSGGAKSDFAFNKSNPYDSLSYSKYTFPEHNLSFFAENIFRINSKLSIIPGLRYESIDTKANGFYNKIKQNLSSPYTGVVDGSQLIAEDRVSKRSFLIGGLGFSYDQSKSMQLYANVSQNYRSINFNNMSIINPNAGVDPNLKDEKGYSADIGTRGHIKNIFTYDLSVFYINYNNRIGVVQIPDSNFTYTTNIAQSRNIGLESFAELDVWKLIKGADAKTKLSVFSNLSLIDARYINSKEPAYEHKKVEFVPPVIFKTGLAFRSGKLSAAYQFSYTAKQYGDATNAETPSKFGISGPIPSYFVMDLSADYNISKMFLISATLNNLSNHMYYTRRADSYPGPGIIPADGRSFYCTLQVKL